MVPTLASDPFDTTACELGVAWARCRTRPSIDGVASECVTDCCHYGDGLGKGEIVTKMAHALSLVKCKACQTQTPPLAECLTSDAGLLEGPPTHFQILN